MPFPLPFRERRRGAFMSRMHPLEARTHARALANLGGERSLLVPGWAVTTDVDDSPARHTAVVAALAGHWVWPRWLRQQIEPASPAFTHPGVPARIQNVTGRTWTRIGTLDDAGDASVDPDGLVQPLDHGASLDWWIRDSSGWRFPSTDAVEQTTLDGTPVVVTTMRVPGETGGDIRTYAYGAAADPPVAIVEIQNATEAPVAVALAVRPCNRESVAIVASIGLDGDEVRVNGDLFVRLLDGPPAYAIMSDFARGDVARRLGEHEPEAAFRTNAIEDPTGLASAAFIYALEHGASLRAALPLVSAADAPPGEIVVEAAPRPANVARGWKRQSTESATLTASDARVGAAFDAQRHYLLLMQRGGWGGDGVRAFPELAFVLGALGGLNRHDVVAGVLDEITRRQLQHRFLLGREDSWDAMAAAAIAVAEYWRLTRDRELVEDLMPVVELVVDAVEASSATPGLRPRSGTPEFLGPPDAYFWDTFFVLRALADVEAVAADLDARRVSERAGDLRLLHRDALDAALDRIADATGLRAMPAGPRRRLDGAALGTLVGCYPLGVLDADDARVVATSDYLWDTAVRDGRFFHPITYAGWAPHLSLQLAGTLMRRGDPRAWPLVDGFLTSASPTWTWPVAQHPASGMGCFGSGHDTWTAAACVSILFEMCVHEHEYGLDLFPGVPDAIDELTLSGMRTRFGILDLRYARDGDTRALTWRGRWGATTPTLRAPAFDPDWSTSEAAGAATLR